MAKTIKTIKTTETISEIFPDVTPGRTAKGIRLFSFCYSGRCEIKAKILESSSPPRFQCRKTRKTEKTDGRRIEAEE